MKEYWHVILGVSLVLAALIFGMFFYSAKSGDDTIRVVGSATKSFESDVIKWRVTVSRASNRTELSKDYALLQKNVEDFIAFLKEKGLQENEISQQPINIQQMAGEYGKMSTDYSITQGLFVISTSIPLVEKLALDPSVLFEKGVVLQWSNLEYYVSKLPEIKAKLLADATKDARNRAEEMANSMIVKVGKLISLRAGVIQITEPFSTEVSDYGMYSTSTKQKDISVTVTVVFRIK